MRKRELKTRECLNCGEPVVSKYCSTSCQMTKRYEEFISQWQAGLETGWSGRTRQISNHIRRYLLDTRGTECSICGWDVRHPTDGAVLTEINHIDGDAENNNENNLEILCPNCHSMTVNFRARNSNSSRQR